MTAFEHGWTALSASPAFGLGLTLVCYQAAGWLQARVGGSPLLNPVLLSITVIVVLLVLTGTDYAVYFKGARWVNFLLGPATVALAIPLYKHLGEIRRSAIAIVGAVSIGAVTASASAVATAWYLGASPEVVRSIAPKTATTAIAIGVSGQIGGIPEPTAVLVVITGVLGGLWAPEILDFLGVRCWRAKGIAAGVAGHGIATARMLALNETAGAFAGLAMGLCGLFTALLPLLAHLLPL